MRRISLLLVLGLWLISCGTSGGEGSDPGLTSDLDPVGDQTATDSVFEDTSDCAFAAFSPPGDPCMVCTCGEDPTGPPACSPVDVGTPCTSENCCVTGGHCVQCDEGDLSCPASGMQCSGQPSVNCEDSDPCTLDLAICDGDDNCTCSNSPAIDGAPCLADENACTVGDTCQSGTCVQGEPVSLESENICVELVCVKGEVTEKILTGDCSDGDPCTLGDSCKISGDSAACIPDALVECPDVACATSSQCDSELGECVVEWGPTGNACETNDPCSIGACEADPEDEMAQICVANPICPTPSEPCLVAICDAEAATPETMCSTQMVENGTMCVGGGVCNDGDCSVNVPPSAPTVAVTPTEPGPGDALTCNVTADGVDPEGETVTYEYRWLRDGQPTVHTTAVISGGVTNACETWTCEVTPWAAGLPGVIGSDFVTVGSGSGGGDGPTYKVHSWEPGQTPGAGLTPIPWITGFFNGEGVGTRITFDPADLPYTIGVVRGLLPAGQQWRGAVWQDNCGATPCTNEVGSGAPVSGQGPAQMVESALGVPVTVTADQPSVVVGFMTLSGNLLEPAGPMYYDGDGTQGTNWVLGSLLGGGVAWSSTSSFDPTITDWVVEVGPGTITCD
jgi:hypothetical protein